MKKRKGKWIVFEEVEEGNPESGRRWMSLYDVHVSASQKKAQKWVNRQKAPKYFSIKYFSAELYEISEVGLYR